ncbi:LPXTG cell wall anchor domain-containing protein [Streptococcus suis]|uniref:LPXTG cell wall anchor domain-containing protein n=1 Tax=Streptococcus suis TaxID=1307 RepID=UPI003A5C5065
MSTTESVSTSTSTSESGSPSTSASRLATLFSRSSERLPNTGEGTSSASAYGSALLLGTIALLAKRRKRDDKQE